ncbi:MAG: hypothetical protein ABMA01_05575 [Chthoniobacteraceae bacterium]
MIRVLILAGLLPLVSGCGRSGTWTDDKNNWTRAFQQEQPKDITVVHSWYCRTAHFTHESQYFFQLAPNDTLRKSVSDPARVFDVLPDDTNAQEALQLALYQKPSWFASKAATAYQIFRGKPPQDNYFVLVERDSGSIFITERIGM